MLERKKQRAGYGFYKKAGLEKALLIHLSLNTHKKLVRKALANELSLQKTVRKILEEAVKDDPMSKS